MFDADTELRSQFDDFVLSQMNRAGDNAFMIPGYPAWSATSDLKPEDTLIFDWDSTDPSILT